MGKLIFLIFSILLISVVVAENLQLGDLTDAKLVYVKNVKSSGKPLKIKTKNVFYYDESVAPRVIKAVTVMDMDQSNARVVVTAGGVGYTFVNIVMESELGRGLNYLVQIFA